MSYQPGDIIRRTDNIFKTVEHYIVIRHIKDEPYIRCYYELYSFEKGTICRTVIQEGYVTFGINTERLA